MKKLKKRHVQTVEEILELTKAWASSKTPESQENKKRYVMLKDQAIIGRVYSNVSMIDNKTDRSYLYRVIFSLM